LYLTGQVRHPFDALPGISIEESSDPLDGPWDKNWWHTNFFSKAPAEFGADVDLNLLAQKASEIIVKDSEGDDSDAEQDEDDYDSDDVVDVLQDFVDIVADIDTTKYESVPEPSEEEFQKIQQEILLRKSVAVKQAKKSKNI
jgi:hypothetical protein